MKIHFSKILGTIWLLGISLLSIYFYQDQSQVEKHALTKVLSFGYDAFGRNCFLLTSTAIIESLKMILPLGLFCVVLSLLSSSLLIIKNIQVDFLFRTFLDTLSSLPGFLIALSLSVLFTQSYWTFILGALLMVYPGLTRFFEGQILKLKTEEFIKASEALGGSPFHLFATHYLPELFRILISIFPFIFTRLLLIETSLSFLGLGTAPDHESWGRLLYQGKDYFLEAPWILAIAGIPLCLTLFSFHLLSRPDQN